MGLWRSKGQIDYVNYWWNMGDISTKSRYFIKNWYLWQLFSLYTCNYGLYIYKYWFKMLKRWKFPPLIKAHASSRNWNMDNLTCSRPTQHSYIQFMLNFTRFISFLLYKSLVQCTGTKHYVYINKNSIQSVVRKSCLLKYEKKRLAMQKSTKT